MNGKTLKYIKEFHEKLRKIEELQDELNEYSLKLCAEDNFDEINNQFFNWKNDTEKLLYELTK